MFSAFQNILRFLVDFIADAVGIRSGCGNQEIQRLHSGIAGTFGHNIKQFPIGLRVKFIEHNPVNVETVLGISLGGKYLIKAVCRKVHDAFL